MVTKEEYLQQNGVILNSVEKPKILSPSPVTSDDIERKRSELELKKLQIEIDKLSAPNTSIDYFQKMLELQQNHFSQQMQMFQQQADLKLEIEKLKLGADGDGDSMLPYLQMLMPLLPQIINKNHTPAPSAETKKEAPAQDVGALQTQEEEEKEVKVPTNAGELEEYKEAVRRGEITFEEAYEDFLTTPFANALTKEQFRLKFEAIKNEKPKKAKQKTL